MPSKTTAPVIDTENLYHVILETSHIAHDPNSEVDKVRICGTYTALPAAKGAAHRCLFDAGYEQEWFTTFDTQHKGGSNWSHGDGVIVYAVAPAGDTFATKIATSPNVSGFKGNADGKIEQDLYHVVHTTIFYDRDQSGTLRETSVVGSYESYAKARAAAHVALVNKEDGITEQSWEEYDEMPTGATDWEYGMDVIVHAVGQGGENVWLSVLKNQEMESVRLEEAARRMRS